MGLLDLPPELRLEILSHLPDFIYGRHETIGPNVRLTPCISRVCRTLRQESLPLYVKTSAFVIQTDDHWTAANNRVHVWLQALDDEALAAVENLQLSQHWKITQPARWQGHVGFYVRLQLRERQWHCVCGTYPIANDLRGMRLESIDVLQKMILRRLAMALNPSVGGKRFSRADVEFVVAAMDVVASNPISAFDTEQSDAGRKRRRQIFEKMESQLLALDGETTGTGG